MTSSSPAPVAAPSAGCTRAVFRAGNACWCLRRARARPRDGTCGRAACADHVPVSPQGKVARATRCDLCHEPYRGKGLLGVQGPVQGLLCLPLIAPISRRWGLLPSWELPASSNDESIEPDVLGTWWEVRGRRRQGSCAMRRGQQHSTTRNVAFHAGRRRGARRRGGPTSRGVPAAKVARGQQRAPHAAPNPGAPEPPGRDGGSRRRAAVGRRGIAPGVAELSEPAPPLLPAPLPPSYRGARLARDRAHGDCLLPGCGAHRVQRRRAPGPRFLRGGVPDGRDRHGR